eukprot:TRINITY_DN785_c0_g5_i2.p2 TRINITY_DN785_c0_g5~~TRINITY_DN785_c0_g5_i2.p2  ORF type:complete len:363 (+),score=111.40 TRINITY_DN785_c0_g5_i2:78-1091(+)
MAARDANKFLISESFLAKLDEDKLRAVAESLEVCLLGVKKLEEMREKINTLRQGKTVERAVIEPPQEEPDSPTTPTKPLTPTKPGTQNTSGRTNSESGEDSDGEKAPILSGAFGAFGRRGGKAGEKWRAAARKIKAIRAMQGEIGKAIRSESGAKSDAGTEALCQVLDENTNRMVQEIDVRDRQVAIMRRRLGLPDDDEAAAPKKVDKKADRPSSATMLPSLTHSLKTTAGMAPVPEVPEEYLCNSQRSSIPMSRNASGMASEASGKQATARSNSGVSEKDRTARSSIASTKQDAVPNGAEEKAAGKKRPGSVASKTDKAAPPKAPKPKGKATGPAK